MSRKIRITGKGFRPSAANEEGRWFDLCHVVPLNHIHSMEYNSLNGEVMYWIFMKRLSNGETLTMRTSQEEWERIASLWTEEGQDDPLPPQPPIRRARSGVESVDV